MPEKSFDEIQVSIKNSLNSTIEEMKAIQGAAYKVALEKAGGDKYSVEKFGYDVPKFSVISKIEELAKSL
jgi:hypothetical protein